MSEGSGKKTKILIVVALLIMFVPIYLLTSSGMDRWFVKPCLSDEKLNEPKNPAHLFLIARVFDWTGRSGESDEILKQWIIRYGGDETNIPVDERWFDRWLDPTWLNTNPRRPNWPRVPDPLTPQVVLLFADHMDDQLLHEVASFLRRQVIARFPNDKDAIKKAQGGLDHDKQRSF